MVRRTRFVCFYSVDCDIISCRFAVLSQMKPYVAIDVVKTHDKMIVVGKKRPIFASEIKNNKCITIKK